VHLAETEMRYGLDTPVAAAHVKSSTRPSAAPTPIRRTLRRAS
jgi:hypothetical protein